MMKERLAAVVIGGIMLFSVAGYAFMGLGRMQPAEPKEIPTIIEEHLSSEQVVSILRQGRVLIRNVHTTDCQPCLAADAELEMFARSMKGYVVLEKAVIEPDNETGSGYLKLEMLSPTGDVNELNENRINEEHLLSAFCEISPRQPRECLLREF